MSGTACIGYPQTSQWLTDDKPVLRNRALSAGRPGDRHETHLSAEQNRAQASARLSRPHGNGRGSQGSGPPARPWPQEIVGLTFCDGTGLHSETPRPKLERLKNRQEFLRAARGVRRVTTGMTLELCPTPETGSPAIRVGFTASRKIGNAVARNRARRRLKAAALQVLPLFGLPGNDYVLVARRDTLTRPFGGLLDDLVSALNAAHARLGRPTA